MNVRPYVLCDYGSLQVWRDYWVMRAADGWGRVLQMDAFPVTGCRYEEVYFFT